MKKFNIWLLLLPFLLITNSFALFGPISTPDSGMNVYIYATSQLDIVFFMVGLTIATFIYTFIISPLVFPLLILYLIYEIINAFVQMLKLEGEITDNIIFNAKIFGKIIAKLIGLFFFLWAIPVEILVLSAHENNNALEVNKLTDYFNKYQISGPYILTTDSTPKELGFDDANFLSLPQNVPIKAYFSSIPFAKLLEDSGYARLSQTGGPVYFELPAFIAFPLGVGESLIYGFYKDGKWYPGYVPSMFPGAFKLILGNPGDIIDAIFTNSAENFVTSQINNEKVLKDLYANKVKLNAETNIALQAIITNYIGLLYEYEAKAIVNFYLVFTDKGADLTLKTGRLKTKDDGYKDIVVIASSKGTGITASDFAKKIKKAIEDIQKINSDIANVINTYYVNLYPTYKDKLPEEKNKRTVLLAELYENAKTLANIDPGTFDSVYKNATLGNNGLFYIEYDGKTKGIYFPKIDPKNGGTAIPAGSYINLFYKIYTKFTLPEIYFQNVNNITAESVQNVSSIVADDEHTLMTVNKTNRDFNKDFNDLLTNFSLNSGTLNVDYHIPLPNQDPDNFKMFTPFILKYGNTDHANVFVIDSFYPDLNNIPVHNNNNDISVANIVSYYDILYNKNLFDPLLYIGYELDTTVNLLLYDFYNQVTNGAKKGYECGAEECTTFVPFKEPEFSKGKKEPAAIRTYYANNLNAWMNYAFSSYPPVGNGFTPKKDQLPFFNDAGGGKVFRIPAITYNYYLLRKLNDDLMDLFKIGIKLGKTPEGNEYPFSTLNTLLTSLYNVSPAVKKNITNNLATEMEKKNNEIYNLNKNIINSLINDNLLPDKGTLDNYKKDISNYFYSLVNYVVSPIKAQPITEEDTKKSSNDLPAVEYKKGNESGFWGQVVKVIIDTVLFIVFLLLKVVFIILKIIAEIMFSLVYSLHTLGIILVFIFAPITFVINVIFKDQWMDMFKLFKEYLAYRLIDLVLILEIYILGILGPVFMFMLDNSNLPNAVIIIFKIFLIVFIFKLFSILINLIFNEILGVKDILGLAGIASSVGNTLGKYSGGAAVQAGLFGGAMSIALGGRAGKYVGAATETLRPLAETIGNRTIGAGWNKFKEMNPEAAGKLTKSFSTLKQKTTALGNNEYINKLKTFGSATGKVVGKTGNEVFDILSSSYDLAMNRNVPINERLMKAIGKQDLLGSVINESPRGKSREEFIKEEVERNIKRETTRTEEKVVKEEVTKKEEVLKKIETINKEIKTLESKTNLTERDREHLEKLRTEMSNLNDMLKKF